jgi:hypothetical protein
VTDHGFKVSGAVTITNESSGALTIQSITDKLNDTPTTLTCTPAFTAGMSLAADASLVCDYEELVPVAEGSDLPADGTNEAWVELADGAVFYTSADYTFVGVTPNEEGYPTVNVTDTYEGTLGSASDDHTFEYSRSWTCDGDEGTYPNTATITETGQNDSEEVTVTCVDLGITKTVETRATRTWDWDITKTVEPASWDLFTGENGTSEYTVSVTKDDVPEWSDWSLSGEIRVTNNSGLTANITGVTDMYDGAALTVTCPGTSFPTAYPLQTGNELVCSYSGIDADGSGGDNVATVHIATATFSSSAVPVDFTTPDVIDDVYDEINVTDTNGESWGPVSDDDSWTYERTFDCDDAGDNPNTATIDETGDSDDANVTVACHEISVTKTAVTSFNRYWTWEITKAIDASCFLQIGNVPTGFDETADPPKATIQQNESLYVCYDIGIDADYADDDWAVSGGITVSNEGNPIPAVINDVTDLITADDIGGNPDCEVTFPHTIPAGETLECSYGADLPDASSRTNTATATQQLYSYDKDKVGTALTTADESGSAAVIFSADPDDEIDECVDVDDMLYKSGLQVDVTQELGTYCADQELPHTFDVTRYFPIEGIPLECGDNVYDNTATLVTNDTETELTADASINIYVECQVGCTLTLGYWKTHNQGFHDQNPNGMGPPLDPTWGLLDAWYYDDGLAMWVEGDGSFDAEDEPFFLSEQTWFEVFWTKPQGNVYYNLAWQYMAAVLNGLGGADQSAVATELAEATDLFKTYTPAEIGALKGKPSDKALRDQFIDLAGTLAEYNEGLIGPGHCAENVTPG